MRGKDCRHGDIREESSGEISRELLPFVWFSHPTGEEILLTVRDKSSLIPGV